MGQPNLEKTAFRAQVNVQNGKDDDKQDVDFTGYFLIGDEINVVEIDPAGEQVGPVAFEGTVLNKTPNFLVLSGTVDTQGSALSDPANKFMIESQQIWTGQEAVDRLYRNPPTGSESMDEQEPILDFALDEPSGGKGTYDIADSSFFRVGDLVDILADEGTFVTDAVIEDVDNRADDANNTAIIQIDQSIDLAAATNPFFINKTLTVKLGVIRNQERLDEMDKPIVNEDGEVVNGLPDGLHNCYKTSLLFREGTSLNYIDGVKKTLGTPGTRAQHVEGASDAELTFDSMLLGLLGNEVEIEVVNAPGLAVTVTRSYNNSATQIIPGSTSYLVSINSNSGAATALEIANALNADASVQRILQAIWGGDGSGTVTPFGPTNLLGGLDDGTKDYAELEQVFENKNVNTGFKFVSYHLRPNEVKRMDRPPKGTEDIEFAFRQIIENQDR